MTISPDALVIGAGPAGLAAAAALRESGVKNILVAEREPFPGGVLLQCIHNGFGLHRYRQELTGPEYAEISLESAEGSGVEIVTNTAVLTLKAGNGIEAVLLSPEKGVVTVRPKAVILAMGCRERTRGGISIPGSRPAGIMTAGLAQKLVNLEGYLPGKEIVILGSGDIGLIMARRLTWEGARVKAVVELQPYPGGLLRNVVQCLEDFHIPLYLSHTIAEIRGNERISEVVVCPVGPGMEPNRNNGFVVSCDTLLLSVGLIPENELSREAGVELHQVTGGPVVDDNLMTSVSGIFACGNVLHVHDLVDFVSEEAELCGRNAAAFILGTLPAKSGETIPARAGNLVRYVLPMSVSPGKDRSFSFRPIAPLEDGELTVRQGDGTTIVKKRIKNLHPSSMFHISVPEISREAGFIEVSITERLKETREKK